MTDRASIFETIQIGVETTPGTPVAALKKLQSLSIEPAVKVETKKFRAMGNKYPSLVIPGKEWTLSKLSGVATYTEIVYALASVLGYAAPVQQDSTEAYLWTHSSKTSSPDTVKTYTVEQGSWLRAHRFSNGLITSLGLSFSREGIDVSGEMIGSALEDNVHLSRNARYTLTANATPPTAGTFTLTLDGQTTAAIAFDATAAEVEAALEALSTIGVGNVEVTATVAEGAGDLSEATNVYSVEFVNELAQTPLTLTGTFTTLTASGSIALASAAVGAAPAGIDLVPVLPTEIDIYRAAAHDDLAVATALYRVLKVDWNISERFGPVYPLRTSYGNGFANTVEIEPSLEIEILMEADEEGMTPLSDLRQGDTFFLRIEAVGDVIEDPYYYKLRIDTAVKVSDVGEFSDEDGVYAVPYTLTAVHDSTWGKAMEVTVINKLTSL